MSEPLPELRLAHCTECGCDREARLMHEVAENGLPYTDLVCNERNWVMKVVRILGLGTVIPGNGKRCAVARGLSTKLSAGVAPDDHRAQVSSTFKATWLCWGRAEYFYVVWFIGGDG